MSNPILSALNTGAAMTSNLKRIKEMVGMIKGARNPQVILSQMASNNPQMKSVLDMVQTGGDPKQIFFNACKQKGIDPEQILSAMK